ncbi:MAG: hypothetical protein ACREOK_12070 [Gemmatimonadaceae bacterium]
MTTRKVKDEDGRVWRCEPEGSDAMPGKDVSLLCRTTGVQDVIRVKVSWQWAKMAEKGLARMILSAVR